MMKIITPFLLILFGLFVLLMIGQPIVSGICFLLGIVMIIECIWPEKWKSDEQLN